MLKRYLILLLTFSYLLQACSPVSTATLNQDLIEKPKTIVTNTSFQHELHENLSNNSQPEISAKELQTEQPKINISYHTLYFDNEADAINEIESINNSINIRPDTRQYTTVISSDEVGILNKIDQQNILKNKTSSFLILNNSATRFANSGLNYLKKSYKDDKIGFIVAIYTTAVETVMWLHIGPASTLEKSANIVFTIAMALYFKLNKDHWTDLTKKIKKPLESFLNQTNQKTIGQQIRNDFLANLALSTTLSFARIPLMSMEQIINEGLTLDLFKLPFLSSLIGTASFFSWSEHQGSIDKNSHPISKFMFRRLSEVRSITIATFASSAMLLNPTTYGMAPWIILVAVGIGGLSVYLNGQSINQWVENREFLKKYENLMKTNSVQIYSCKELFI